MYYVTVIVDTTLDKIVAASTLFMERKFIRGCALVSDIIIFDTEIIVNLILVTESSAGGCCCQPQL